MPVERTQIIEQRINMEYGVPCVCGRSFSTLKGMKIHRSKKGCGGSFPVEQQRTVCTDKTLEDLCQDSNHSVENIHADLSGEDLVYFFDGKRDKIKFPPASAKPVWEDLDKALSKELDKHLRQSTLQHKLEIFGDIVYLHCRKEFGVKEEGRRTIPQKSRRQQKIATIRKQKNHVRKQFRQAVGVEKDGLRQIWQHLKTQHNALCKAERLCRKKRQTRKARESFFREPFKFAKELFEQPRSGTLTISKESLEEHLRKSYSDTKKDAPLGDIAGLVWPSQPGVKFNVSPPTIQEVNQVVQKARCKSAPGPNGIPYALYKRCPEVLKRLHRLLKSAWKTRHISREWKKANGVYIPKEQNSADISQFRPISLLNVEGKIFFSVMAKRLTAYLLDNGYVDTSVQKGGVPGFPGCLEHATMIWEAIQRAKKEKQNLYVIWLDLANAYGSVPHQMLWQALQMYHVPPEIATMLERYFQGFTARFSTKEYTTAWIELQVGIAMGCTISPILFVLAMQVILKAAEGEARGPAVDGECYMPPLKAFMDDTTILGSNESQARKILGRLEELIRWCRMSFKPSKSRSLVLKKGKVVEVRFMVAEQIIPTVNEEPVKSLGRRYDASLRDTNAVQEIREMADKGLQIIDRCRLIGKFKIWCLQFMLIPKLLWPLLIYEVSSSTVETIEGKINKFTRKWLGVPPGLSDVALYCANAKLKLPFKSVLEEYKAGKARLSMMLCESEDAVVRAVQPTIKTGRKWKVSEAVSAARENLELKEKIGYTQRNRRGFGHGDIRWWSKASVRERRDMVVQEIREAENSKRFQKAVQQRQQGQWTTWEGALQRSLTWNDVWHMAPLRLSFIIRSIYDLLPTGANLVKWGKTEDARCPLCAERQTLEHVLSACKVALGQGRYTWRHNKVLSEVAAAVDGARLKANSKVSPRVTNTYFLRAGQSYHSKVDGGSASSILDGANDWEIAVDLPGRGAYPDAIRRFKQRPDIVLYATGTRQIVMVEVTVPFESRLEEQHMFKMAKYSDLVTDLRNDGYGARCYAIEVGARGLLAATAYDLCKQLGLRGRARSRALKSFSETAEKASCWLWSKRNDQWSA